MVWYEEVKDEIDFISTTSPSMCEVQLAVGADPFLSTGHKVRYAITAPDNLVVRLRQGNTTIASWSHSSVALVTTFEQTLTAEQVDAITNYADLRLQFEVL